METCAGEGCCLSPQASVMPGKAPELGALGAAEKKVRMLEQQRMEVGVCSRVREDPCALLEPAG